MTMEGRSERREDNDGKSVTRKEMEKKMEAVWKK